MKAKVGNQKAAQYMIGDGYCSNCAFYSKSSSFYISMNCDVDGLFYQNGTLEDIFHL